MTVVELLTENRTLGATIGEFVSCRDLVAIMRTNKAICACFPARGQFNLNALIEMYTDAATADQYGMACTLVKRVRKLASWTVEADADDSEEEDATSDDVPFEPRKSSPEQSDIEVAIHESADAISAALTRYRAWAPIEFPRVDLDRLMGDMEHAYGLLQGSHFASLCTHDMSLIVGLVKEVEWPEVDKRRLEPTVGLMEEFVELSGELKRLANASTENDQLWAAKERKRILHEDFGRASEGVEEKHLRYDLTTIDQHDSYNWARVEGVDTFGVEMALRFSRREEEDDSESSKIWPLTAKWAYRLQYVLTDTLTDWGESAEKWQMSGEWEQQQNGFALPRVARAFWRKSEQWRHNYRGCFLRLACRLQLGLLPKPNCVGEMCALHQIIDHATEVDSWIEENLELEGEDAGPNPLLALPDHSDDSKEQLLHDFLQDEDYYEIFVEQQLWKEGDNRYGRDDDEEEDDKLEFPSGFAHPAEWFTAFDNGRFKDHINPKGQYSEGCHRQSCAVCGDSSGIADFKARDFSKCPDLWGPRPSRNSSTTIWRPEEEYEDRLFLQEAGSRKDHFFKWPESFLGIPAPQPYVPIDASSSSSSASSSSTASSSSSSSSS